MPKLIAQWWIAMLTTWLVWALVAPITFEARKVIQPIDYYNSRRRLRPSHLQQAEGFMQSEPIVRRFETRPHCEICGRMRSAGGHDRCSKIRQRKHLQADIVYKPKQE